MNDVDRQKKTATLYDSSKLDEKDKYALFLGGNTGLLDIRTTADKTDRLLLIKDSYANCFVPFLTAYYREIFVVDPRYYTGDIHEIMEEKKISVIGIKGGLYSNVGIDVADCVITSDTPSVATVSDGVVKGVGSGTAYINVEYEGLKDVIKVVVS